MLTHIKMYSLQWLYGIVSKKNNLKKTQTSESHIRTSKEKKKPKFFKNRFINKTRDLFIIMIAILEY